MGGIDTCSSGELPALTAQLDQAFVFGKGRRLSLARRYPAVLGAANLGNLYVRRLDGVIAACVAVRPFDWVDGGNRWRGAMIGMVWTAGEHRRRGHALALLSAAIEVLRGRAIDFAVLWTGLDGYYERLGFVRRDRGHLGCWTPDAAPASGAKTSGSVAVPGRREPDALTASEDWLAVEERRRDRLDQYLPRTADDYAAVPIPADLVQLHAAGPAGHALVGVHGNTRYLYELVGDPESFPTLWQAAVRGADRVYVNDVIGSASQVWLNASVPIAWQPQRLAMWLPLSRRLRVAAAGEHWHIPYFDRI